MENNKSPFVQREKFEGILGPIVIKRLGEKTQRNFDELNKAIKKRAES